MKYNEMIQYAKEEGFTAAEIMDTKDIAFDSSFRAYCEENLCGQYGANPSCPPGCGSPEIMKQKILAHEKALILQSIGNISKGSGMAAILPLKTAHNDAEIRLVKRLQAEGIPGFLVGASGCALCSPCKQTLGQPCSFPEYQYSCMSAYCICVKDLAEKCHMEYDWVDGQLMLFGMYVFD